MTMLRLISAMLLAVVSSLAAGPAIAGFKFVEPIETQSQPEISPAHRVLYLIAIGIDEYPQAGPNANLAAAVNDARELHRTLIAAAQQSFVKIGESWLKKQNTEKPQLGNKLDVAVSELMDTYRLRVLSPGDQTPFYDRIVTKLLIDGGGDGEPTRANILKSLDIIKQADENDTVIFSFSGHGGDMQRWGSSDYLIMPSDTRKLGRKWDENSVVLWHDVEAALLRAKGKRIVILDTHDRPPFDTSLDPEIVVWVAALRGSTVQELKNPRHGAFTLALIDGLRGEADGDGNAIITLLELDGYVTKRVRELTTGNQEPRLFTDGSRNFRLAMAVEPIPLLARLDALLVREKRSADALGNVNPKMRAAQVLTPDEDGRLSPTYSNSHALLIGVSDYKSDEYWYDLPGAKRDVERIAMALEEVHGFEVTTVIDPTKEDLEQAFENFVYGPGQEENARLLVYFAGHGHTTRNGPATIGWVVPSDGIDPQKDPIKFRRNAINMRRILEHSENILSKHVLWLFDSCFGGTIFKKYRSRGKSGKWEDHLKKRKVRRIITSGSADQKVPDESVFAELFLQALKGERQVGDDDGLITGVELGHYLKSSVVDIRGDDQTPQQATVKMFGAQEGDIVFRVIDAPVAAAQ